jgi:pyridoxal phosphate enzyme (YggS family)
MRKWKEIQVLLRKIATKMGINENYEKIRSIIPDYVTIMAAAKTRTATEVAKAIDVGITDIGENYVQEAERVYNELDEKAKRVRWHMIGHLQTNKINKALGIFDVIQTVDSKEKAYAINKRASNFNKVLPILIEVNIGSELSKSGLKPEYDLIESVVREMAEMDHLQVEGIMTMGPAFGNPEHVRPYFRKTKEIFDRIHSLDIKGVDFKTLSMGMSNSYRVAVEEGSNMIRLGTVLFGERKY